MRDALAAEWTKLRTQQATRWLMLGTAVAMIGISAAVCTFTHVSSHTTGGDSTKTSLTGIYLGQLVVATLAILSVTEEYATGMIRATFTAIPRRSHVLGAKAVTLAAVTLPVGALAAAGCLLAGRIMLPGAGLDPAHGYAIISISHSATIRAVIGTVIYLLLIALLSLGVGTVIRDTAVAIGAVFSLLFGPELLARIVGGASGRHIDQLSPMTAGLNVEATTKLHSLAIAPWPGLAVCTSWAAAALIAAALALRLRDA